MELLLLFVEVALGLGFQHTQDVNGVTRKPEVLLDCRRARWRLTHLREGGLREGRTHACRYAFPRGVDTPASDDKDCYAWCAGTLSAAHANVSLLQTRLAS